MKNPYTSGRDGRGGGCLCGKIRYMLMAEPAVVAICHCTNCQKQGGGAFSVNLALARADVRMSGELSVFEDKADSGGVVLRGFCGACGSPILSELPGRPKHVYVKAGTLDDRSGIVPTMQVWCRSAQPWVELNKNLPTFERQALA
ncbi:GFA family protein [Achromobacter sp.]|uniref:GFA family protein n=1 Tax=Achromobacter sp. TaxID=134375 RepID=UPI003C7152C9